MADMVFLTRLKPEPMGVHDISTAYGINSLVMSEDGAAAYLSVKDVPAGTALTNTQYWKVHTDLSEVKQRAEEATAKALAARDEMMEIARNLAEKAEAEGNPVQAADLVGGLPFGSVETVLEPKQAGSGDPAPENVRPITGWTGVQLTRTGKNLLDVSCVPATQTLHGVTLVNNGDGTLTFSGTALNNSSWAFKFNVPIPAGTYTFSANNAKAAQSGALNLYFMDGNGTDFVATALKDTVNASRAFVANTPITHFKVFFTQGVVADGITIRPQLEIGKVATAYEPYQAVNLSSDFGQTIYGGTYHWETGVLTVDWKAVMLTGADAWVAYGDAGALLKDALSDAIIPAYEEVSKNILCSHFMSRKRSSIAGATEIGVSIGSGKHLVIYLGQEHATPDTAKAFFAAQDAAGTPVQVAWKLATPITIQLTPQEIKQLEGTNVLCGDGSIAVTGYQDPHPALKARLAALESAMLNA